MKRQLSDVERKKREGGTMVACRLQGPSALVLEMGGASDGRKKNGYRYWRKEGRRIGGEGKGEI